MAGHLPWDPWPWALGEGERRKKKRCFRREGKVKLSFAGMSCAESSVGQGSDFFNERWAASRSKRQGQQWRHSGWGSDQTGVSDAGAPSESRVPKSVSKAEVDRRKDGSGRGETWKRRKRGCRRMGGQEWGEKSAAGGVKTGRKNVRCSPDDVVCL